MSLHRSLFTWFTLLVFFVLLVLRLDNRTQWNWFVVFIPIWIFNSILFMYSTFDIVSLCKNRSDYSHNNIVLHMHVIGAVMFKMAFEIMLCSKLESPSINLTIANVMSPLWVILPFMALYIFLTLINK
ncbi:UNVERIFIED_CONTAM: hypothetical protein PYX00_000423 [Menopon gallinae]|uniref:Uncharacterized protein n=1 Tax=Menopon gallinae TaxID=328185 RepID=A0AAW2I939_9NEOP